MKGFQNITDWNIYFPFVRFSDFPPGFEPDKHQSHFKSEETNLETVYPKNQEKLTFRLDMLKLFASKSKMSLLSLKSLTR